MDINEIIQQFCIPIITVTCYCIGFAIKKASFINDKYIPLIMMVLGGLSGMFLNGLSYEAIAVGIVSGASATGVNQLYKQMIKGNDKTNESV